MYAQNTVLPKGGNNCPHLWGGWVGLQGGYETQKLLSLKDEQAS